MRISSKGRVAIGVLAIAGVAALVMWWATQQGKLPTPPPDVTGATGPGASKPVAKPGDTPENTGTTTNVAVNTPANTATQPPDEDQPEQRTWEDKLDDILLSDGTDDQKSDKILALMPYAPVDAQEELSQHLVNMTQDTHYAGTSNLLMNLNTSTNVQEVLLNDLLNRDNTLKLNTLLAILETPSHPMQQNAHDMLELFVQEDYGTNNAAWEKAVADWLKENETPPETQAQATTPDAPQPQ